MAKTRHQPLPAIASYSQLPLQLNTKFNHCYWTCLHQPYIAGKENGWCFSIILLLTEEIKISKESFIQKEYGRKKLKGFFLLLNYLPARGCEDKEQTAAELCQPQISLAQLFLGTNGLVSWEKT